MPNTASAKKRLKQNLARRARNRSTKAMLKTHISRVLKAVGAGEVEKIHSEFRLLAKNLDQAAAKRVIHPNRAARVKSRLSARIKAAAPVEAKKKK